MSQALERMTQRCLEKMPSDRFDGALEACAILEAAAQELGAEPTAPLIRDTLIRARLIDGSPLKGAAERKPRPSEGRVGVTVAGLFVALLLILGRRGSRSSCSREKPWAPRWPPKPAVGWSCCRRGGRLCASSPTPGRT
ncbi:MAG: hypothetical protein WDO74_00230 [Pseudomonadota bacterium]